MYQYEYALNVNELVVLYYLSRIADTCLRIRVCAKV